MTCPFCDSSIINRHFDGSQLFACLTITYKDGTVDRNNDCIDLQIARLIQQKSELLTELSKWADNIERDRMESDKMLLAAQSMREVVRRMKD